MLLMSRSAAHLPGELAFRSAPAQKAPGTALFSTRHRVVCSRRRFTKASLSSFSSCRPVCVTSLSIVKIVQGKHKIEACLRTYGVLRIWPAQTMCPSAATASSGLWVAVLRTQVRHGIVLTL